MSRAVSNLSSTSTSAKEKTDKVTGGPKESFRKFPLNYAGSFLN